MKEMVNKYLQITCVNELNTLNKKIPLKINYFNTDLPDELS